MPTKHAYKLYLNKTGSSYLLIEIPKIYPI